MPDALIKHIVLSGDILRGNVVEVLPFGNEVLRVLVPGQTILEALEHSVSGYDPLDPPGAFLQVSGNIVHHVIMFFVFISRG